MGKTLAQIIPLAAVATFSPTALLFLVFLITSGKKNARRSALFFVTGALASLILLGLSLLLLFSYAANLDSFPDSVSSMVDIAFGLLIGVIVFRSTQFRRNGSRPKNNLHLPFIVMGFFYMITNATTVIPFVAADKIIAEDDLALESNLLLLAIVIVITMLMISIPVIVAYVAPGRTNVLPGSVKDFIPRHGTHIAQVCFLLIAIYLVIKGVRGLLQS